MSGTPANHLSQLSTRWSLVRRAHTYDCDARREALAELIRIYEGAVRCYLGRLVGDPYQAEEMFQEFALRLARGDFAQVDPERGRFRAVVAAALRNLVRDQWRRRRPVRLGDATALREPTSVGDPCDEEFLALYRQKLFRETLDRLAADRHPHAASWATILGLAFADPDAPDAVLAERLAARGETLTPGQFRKRLWAARRAYARHLVRAVAATLVRPTPAVLADELQVLGVLDACRLPLDEWLGGHNCW